MSMDEIIKYVYLIGGATFVISTIIYPILLMILWRVDKKRKLNYDDMIEAETEKNNKLLNDTKLEYEQQFADLSYKELSYDEVNQIVEDIIEDFWANRYYMHYKLKDSSVIPKMDEDIASLSKDICEAIGPNLWSNITKYYKVDYFIEKITRRATILFMDYIKQNKPPSK